MVSLASLWLPVLLSAILVFFASFVAWVVLPHHRRDFRVLPDQDALLAQMRARDLTPGMYALPHTHDRKEVETEAFKEKVRAGPAGFLYLRDPARHLAMGIPLTQAFVHYLVLGVFVAYIGYVTLPAGTEYLTVFRVTGTAALLGHCGALIPRSVFFGFSWSTTWKEVADGIVYALLTAGVFAWLWPG